MDAKICLVTGANGGIGQALAVALARRGARVVLACRTLERGAAARAAFVAAAGAAPAGMLPVDLADQGSIRRMAAAFNEQFERLDVLFNVAAIVKAQRVPTPDGLETMFAVNHLAPFLLTALLLDKLKAGAPSRVLTVAAPSTTSLDFDDLQGERHFNSLQAFGASKMANLLFTYELARRLAGTGVSANAVHPGLVKSDLMQEAPFPIRFLTQLMSSPPEKAGAALADLAFSPTYEGQSGKFFSNGREIRSNAYSYNADNQARLWEASQALTGQAG